MKVGCAACAVRLVRAGEAAHKCYGAENAVVRGVKCVAVGAEAGRPNKGVACSTSETDSGSATVCTARNCSGAQDTGSATREIAATITAEAAG